jgi:hypothetical protein
MEKKEKDRKDEEDEAMAYRHKVKEVPEHVKDKCLYSNMMDYQ